MNDYSRYLRDSVVYQEVLFNLARRGVSVDRNKITELEAMFVGRRDSVHRRIIGDAAAILQDGKILNVNSSRQLTDLFYVHDGQQWVDRKYGEPCKRLTESQMPKLDEETLSHWASRDVHIADDILEYRKYSKLYGTYVESMRDYLDAHDRVHAQLRQKARTGRLACTDPNLQNQPSRSDEGKLIREMFVAGRWGDCSEDICLECMRDIRCEVPMHPDDEMILVVVDYDQIEIKVAAHVSQDTVMLDAINRSNKDIHCLTAANIARLAGLPYTYDDFKAAKKAEGNGTATPLQHELVLLRTRSKSTGFGILYGMGELGLGVQLKLPIVRQLDERGRMRDFCPEARALIDGYYDTYPDIRAAIQQAEEMCKRYGFVQTITGRKRRLPEINSSTFALARRASRQAFNTIIQGSAADIIQTVMIRIEQDPYIRKLGARQLLQVHDELMFEVPNKPDVVEAFMAHLRYIMENPFQQPLSVPLTVSMNKARSWAEAK